MSLAEFAPLFELLRLYLKIGAAIALIFGALGVYEQAATRGTIVLMVALAVVAWPWWLRQFAKEFKRAGGRRGRS